MSQWLKVFTSEVNISGMAHWFFQITSCVTYRTPGLSFLICEVETVTTTSQDCL